VLRDRSLQLCITVVFVVLFVVAVELIEWYFRVLFGIGVTVAVSV
jgi:hypothetical protein